MTTHDTAGVKITLKSSLPDESDVGNAAEWILLSGSEELRVNALFLGVGTSYTSWHKHPPDRHAELNERCRACRWFEPRIFREVSGQRRYLVHRAGRSIIPGEVSYTSHEWVHGAYEVIEVLTTRRRDADTGNRLPYLTHPAARVLAQAASHDKDLNQAYVDRAVA
jgi:hypothetical protein